MTFQKRILLVLVATTACCALGCESFTTGSSASKKKKKDSGSWFSFKKKEYQVPQSMTVTWSNDILTLAGKPPTRGFGGRFFFYNEKTQAIPVDGDLIVYGFDDTFRKHNGEDLGQAEKRFRFTSEQFTTHFSESELGASYSVWIPWDEAYGDQKKIMLIPTFMTKDGRLIRGPASNLNLPGKVTEDPSSGIAQQASALIPGAIPSAVNSQLQDPRLAGTSQVMNGMRTTTIQMPSNSLRKSINSHPISPEIADALARQTGSMQGQAFPVASPVMNSQASVASFGQVEPAVAASSTPNQLMSGPMGATNGMTPFDRSNQAMAQHLSTLPFQPVGSGSVQASGSGQAGQIPASNLGGSSNHFGPGSPQAPALQASQPTSYPIR